MNWINKSPAFVAFLCLVSGYLKLPFWLNLIFLLVGFVSLFLKVKTAWLLIIPLASFHKTVILKKPANYIGVFEGQNRKIYGRLLGPRILKVDSISIGNKAIKVSGNLGLEFRAKFYPFRPIFIEGKITKPDSTKNFNWAWYFKTEGVDFVVKPEQIKYFQSQNIFYRLHRFLDSKVRKFVKDKKAFSLIEAIFLGNRNYLTSEEKEYFRKTGTFHLLALSGLHVGLIFSLIFFILRFLQTPIKGAIIISNLFIWVYLFIVGLRASLLRGVIFTSAFSIAFILERPRNYINSLGLAGLLSLLFFPFWLESAGFLLSYFATFGILIHLPLYPIFKNKILDYISKSFFVSISAQLFIIPILAYFFQGFSIATPILNIPLVFLAWLLLAEVFAGLVFSGYYPVARPFWVVAEKISDSLFWITGKASHFKIYIICSRPSIFLILAFYFVLLFLTIWLYRLKFSNKPA